MPGMTAAGRFALLAAVGGAAPAYAGLGTGQCHVVDVQLEPQDNLQIVAWVERPDGTYVGTIYVTQQTGRFGLGNRPGRFDFNSGPVPGSGSRDLWPYGQRITTFPVWSHRHGMTFPRVIFQNSPDDPESCWALVNSGSGSDARAFASCGENGLS